MEEGFHSIMSSKILLKGCHETCLTLTDNPSTIGTEGFSLQFDELLLQGVPVGSRKVFAMSFLLDTPLILTADLENGGSSTGCIDVQEGTPMCDAINRGDPLPFFVGIQYKDLTTQRGIPCPCGAEADDVGVTFGLSLKRCEKCGRDPERRMHEESRFRVGDRLRAENDFTTDDEEQVLMQAGQCGRVAFVDEDGDAVVQFEGFEADHWLGRSQTSNFWHTPPGDSLTPLRAERYDSAVAGNGRVFKCNACGRRGQYCWLCVMDFGPLVAHSFATTRIA